MKQIFFFLSLFSVLLLTSCGEDSHHFKIEGRLLQMNQGEFYVYSDDGTINGIDTIKVQGGRFAFEMPCEHPATLTIVFPNFSEQPIFAEPGKTATIDGDASHLKMMKIKGSKDNELMTAFRDQISNASPPEIVKYTKQFVHDHADSPVGVWLVKKYFINTPTPDYAGAMELLKEMQAKQPENGALNRLAVSIAQMKNAAIGGSLPAFTAYDINGKMVSSTSLSTGTAVIVTWASWNYNSLDVLRQLQTLYNNNKAIKIVAFSVDGSRKDCTNFLKMSQITYPVVCTEEMFDTKPLKQLSLLTVPGNIIVRDGKIIARNVPNQELTNRLGH